MIMYSLQPTLTSTLTLIISYESEADSPRSFKSMRDRLDKEFLAVALPAFVALGE